MANEFEKGLGGLESGPEREPVAVIGVRTAGRLLLPRAPIFVMAPAPAPWWCTA